MAMKLHMKQLITGIALTALVWSGTALPAPHAAAASKPFGDVPSGYWAERHILKLALQGIITGKGAGKFAPNESIRREDAVVLTLKLLGLADKIDSSGPIGFPGSFKADNYAIPYINEAFKRKILMAEEEYALANLETGKSWGKAPATREWVAKLLVRAMGKEAEAAAKAGQATAFADDASIDVKLRPYVLTAVETGLVSGIDTNVAGVKKTNFEPKSAITRAAMATLFSKAQAKLAVALSGQVTGVLLSVGADKLSVLFDNGTMQDYILTSDTYIAIQEAVKSSPAASLKLYGKATLILDGNGAAGFVEQTEDKTYVNSIDGTFSKLNIKESLIWMSVGDNYKPYAFDASRKLLVTDVQGKPMDLKDIPEGASISLKVDTVRTEGKVVAVAVKQSVVNKTGSGTVVSWDAASGAMQVADSATGTQESLKVSPQAVFTLDDDTPVKRDQLKAGKSIKYEVKAGSVVSIQIAKPIVTSASGKFVSFNKSDRILNYSDNGKLQVLSFAVNAMVKIDGLPNAGWDDLLKDDQLAMTLDANGEVTQVTVTNRGVKTLVGLMVEAYIAKTKSLNLSDAADQPHNFVLGSNIRYDQNGTKLDTAAALILLTTGRRVNVVYTGTDTLISLSFISKFSGKVVENDTTNKKLKIQIDAANTIILPYSSPVVDIYGQSSSTYNDVKAGDQVTVVLNAAQDQVSTIQVEKAGQYEVVSTDTASGKMKVKKSSTTEEIALPSTVALQDDNGGAVSLGQFAAGSIVNITFLGKSTPVKVKSVSLTYGRVASVNAAASTMDMVLSNGTTATKNIGAAPLILNGGTTLSSLSAVQANDRIELRKDENDRTVIEIFPAVAKEFWEYDSSAQAIKVRHSNFTDQYVFSLDSQVYIHQGSTTLNVSSLKDGDNLSLYFVRGKLVEIAKT